MKERFKSITVTGQIKIRLDSERVWVAKKAAILGAIVKVCEQYQEEGYRLTLRQLYYQLVAKDYIPNHDKVYKKLSSLKDDAVYAGLVDWEIFEDRGRIPHRAYFENDVKDAFKRTLNQYRLNRQKGQPKHIEVWTEKDAISDILSRVTHPLTVHLVVNKGYSSSTAMYMAYKRFVKAIKNGKKVTILYFGDHDPSGLDMVRDIRDRIVFFLKEGKRVDFDLLNDWIGSDEGEDFYSDNQGDPKYWFYDEDYGQENFDWDLAFCKAHFTIKHIGLTMEQINQYNPPPNPAKITDPRAKHYIAKYGQVSWEVDALSPAIMTDIVSNALSSEMDHDIYDSLIEREESEQAQIKKIIEKL